MLGHHLHRHKKLRPPGRLQMLPLHFLSKLENQTPTHTAVEQQPGKRKSGQLYPDLVERNNRSPTSAQVYPDLVKRNKTDLNWTLPRFMPTKKTFLKASKKGERKRFPSNMWISLAQLLSAAATKSNMWTTLIPLDPDLRIHLGCSIILQSLQRAPTVTRWELAVAHHFTRKEPLGVRRSPHDHLHKKLRPPGRLQMLPLHFLSKLENQTPTHTAVEQQPGKRKSAQLYPDLVERDNKNLTSAQLYPDLVEKQQKEVRCHIPASTGGAANVASTTQRIKVIYVYMFVSKKYIHTFLCPVFKIEHVAARQDQAPGGQFATCLHGSSVLGRASFEGAAGKAKYTKHTEVHKHLMDVYAPTSIHVPFLVLFCFSVPFFLLPPNV